MEYKSVSLKDIKKDNPRLCLLPLRYFGKCYQCDKYLSKSGIKCDSRIVNPEGERIVNRKIEIREQIMELEKEFKTLKNS